jgi:DNA invertase Pin-like site-specific DNA recombinase
VKTRDEIRIRRKKSGKVIVEVAGKIIYIRPNGQINVTRTGSESNLSRIKEEDRPAIRKDLRAGKLSQREIARKYNVNQSSISRFYSKMQERG